MKFLYVLAFALSISGLSAQSKVTNTVETLPLSKPIPGLGRLGGVAVDQLGIIYVADFRDKVWKVTPTGECTLFADGLYGASGNAIDEKGNLLQSNFIGNTLVRIDRKGKSELVTDQNLNGPVGVATDTEGNIFVCNCSGNTIAKITKDGASRIFSSSNLFNCPNGITLGPKNELYVTNFQNDIIVKVDQQGKATNFATVPGAQGIAHIVYSKENFYVTKIKTNTMHRVTPSGESFLLGGSFTARGNKDGEALAATFAQPNGIAKDPFGELYVNTLDGEWIVNGPGKPGHIEIRKIDIKTITEIFDATLEAEGLDAAVESYWAYRKDPSHQHEDTGVETGTYGWQLMVQRKVKESIRVFSLLSETYPDRWRPYYYLGQVHEIIGQNDQAAAYYKTALEKDPGNASVQTNLDALLKQ